MYDKVHYNKKKERKKIGYNSKNKKINKYNWKNDINP